MNCCYFVNKPKVRSVFSFLSPFVCLFFGGKGQGQWSFQPSMMALLMKICLAKQNSVNSFCTQPLSQRIISFFLNPPSNEKGKRPQQKGQKGRKGWNQNDRRPGVKWNFIVGCVYSMASIADISYCTCISFIDYKSLKFPRCLYLSFFNTVWVLHCFSISIVMKAIVL